MSRLTYITLAACLTVAAVGCSSGPDRADPAAGRSASTPSSAPASTEGPTASAPSLQPPPEPPGGPVADRCGPPDASARWVTLRGPDKARLAAVVVGHGPVTAVYSHQTGSEGLCGFWPFAVWLAKTHGIRSVLLDHCGTGGSACAMDHFADDRVAQLKLAVDWARAHGASRVSLVGASLGGPTVVVTAAHARVDAVVDLSGPVDWRGLNALAAAPRVVEPTLLALAPNDRDATFAQFRRLRAALGAIRTQFLRAPYGHGWDLLRRGYMGAFRPSRIGRAVADWLSGGAG